VMDRIDMDYDAAGRLISSIFASPDNKNTDKTTLVYNAMGALKERRWEYTHQSTEYIPETEGFVAFGVWVPGTKGGTSTKMLTDTSISAFDYDVHAWVTTITYSNKGKLASKEAFTYTTNGLPETAKVFDEKGLLTALRKFICQ
jgi:hypothetical protein